MRFDKIIVMGSNTVACNCLSTLCKDVDSKKLLVIESSINQWSMLRTFCGKWKVEYECIVEKSELDSRLDKETLSQNVLIISANNNHLYKKELVDKPNVEIINFHYSLLPSYRGINIPTWVIFNYEKKTGITWHYVESGIDSGNILSQRVIEITSETTASDIIKTGMRIADEAFGDFYPEILYEHVKGRKIDKDELGKLYLSKNLPNDGIINIGTDSIDTIERMLRAFDIRCKGVLARLKLAYNDNIFFVKDYKISEYDGSDEYTEYNADCLTIAGGSKKIFVELSSQ